MAAARPGDRGGHGARFGRRRARHVDVDVRGTQPDDCGVLRTLPVCRGIRRRHAGAGSCRAAHRGNPRSAVRAATHRALRDARHRRLHRARDRQAHVDSRAWPAQAQSTGVTERALDRARPSRRGDRQRAIRGRARARTRGPVCRDHQRPQANAVRGRHCAVTRVHLCARTRGAAAGRQALRHHLDERGSARGRLRSGKLVQRRFCDAAPGRRAGAGHRADR